MSYRDNNEEIEHLLTKESFMNWLMNKPMHSLYFYATHEFGNLNIKQLYLKEHGLPLDSKIKGL